MSDLVAEIRGFLPYEQADACCSIPAAGLRSWAARVEELERMARYEPAWEERIQELHRVKAQREALRVEIADLRAELERVKAELALARAGR